MPAHLDMVDIPGGAVLNAQRLGFAIMVTKILSITPMIKGMTKKIALHMDPKLLNALIAPATKSSASDCVAVSDSTGPIGHSRSLTYLSCEIRHPAVAGSLALSLLIGYSPLINIPVIKHAAVIITVTTVATKMTSPSIRSVPRLAKLNPVVFSRSYYVSPDSRLLCDLTTMDVINAEPK